MKTKTPELSVVIPAFKFSSKLKRCINSLFSNRFCFEAIFVLYKDIKKLSKYLSKIELHNTNFKIIRAAIPGVSRQRNIGIENAHGKYIMFIDSDDTVDDFYLEKMVSTISLKKVDCVVSPFNFIFKRSIKKSKCFYPLNSYFDQKYILNEIIANQFGFTQNVLNDDLFSPVWNKIYEMNIISNFELRFNENRSKGEDWQFNLDYFRHIKDLFVIDEQHYNYFVTTSSLSHRANINYFEDTFMDRVIFKELYREFDWNCKKKIRLLAYKFYESAVYYKKHFKKSIFYKKAEIMYNYYGNYDISKYAEAFDEKGISLDKSFHEGKIAFVCYLDMFTRKL